ncbi:protein kinase domain-containing protein [Cryptosporidium felis]|nr:protein kinase domain-containing protein [Cryptosporidium felis]
MRNAAMSKRYGSFELEVKRISRSSSGDSRNIDSNSDSSCEISDGSSEIEAHSNYQSPLESSVGGPTLENISLFGISDSNTEDFLESECLANNSEDGFLRHNQDIRDFERCIPSSHHHINDVLINIFNKKKFDSQSYSYSILKLLGYGYYGTVFLARRQNKTCTNQQFVAIKVINFEQMRSNRGSSSENHAPVDIIDQLNDEINILTTLENHPNAINYLESFYIDPHYLAFVTEYVSGYTLRDIYESYGPFSEPMICYVSKSILDVLLTLNNYNYRYKRIHKDIKSSNIMIDCNSCQIKLLDFGVSQILDCILRHNTPKISSGTIQWMSPELLNSSEYNHLTDVWSLGITLLELSTGHIPNIYRLFTTNCIDDNDGNGTAILDAYIQLLTNENKACQSNKRVTQRNDQIINRIKSFSTDYSDFLNEMLVVDPKKRSDPERLLSHHFLLRNQKSTLSFKSNFQNIEKELYYNNNPGLKDLFNKNFSRLYSSVSNLFNNAEVANSVQLQKPVETEVFGRLLETGGVVTSSSSSIVKHQCRCNGCTEGRECDYSSNLTGPNQDGNSEDKIIDDTLSNQESNNFSFELLASDQEPGMES